MLDRAIALAPSPELHVAPGRVGLTGLDSYFWSREPQPISATARAGAVTVTAVATPVQYSWSFGDGEDLAAYGPGGSWKRHGPSSVSHVYETKGMYDLSLSLIWEAEWRTGSGPWSHLGYFSTEAARSYPVREMVAVLVPVE